MVLLALLSFILFFVFDSFMDILQYRFDQSFFASLDNQFWNPKFSWMNKWRDGCPKFGPRFLGSTTVFVFLTDGWHLMKWFRNRMLDFILFSVLFIPYQNFYFSLIITIIVSSLSKVLFEILFSQSSFS